MIANFEDSIFNAARRRGYLELATSCPEQFELSFVGCWVLKHKNDLKVLGMLSEIVGKKIVEWSDLTERTLKNFRDYVLAKMSPNSARTTFAKLKSILNDMKNEVELPCMRFSEILIAKKEPVQNVFLNMREISSLENVVTNNPEEQYVKCIFLICCYTGCRHSDALNLTQENIQEGTLSYVSKKTHTEANLPVHKNLINVMNGYDHSINLLDCYFNDILRNLCERANIYTRVKVRHAGVDKIGSKYEFVSSHTARRSFVTNLYLKGVDLETIAELAGHSDSTMTRRYLCATRGLGCKGMEFFN